MIETFHIAVVRKSADSGFTEVVLEWQCGALNIDESRVSYGENEPDSGANYYRHRGMDMPENRQNYFRQRDGTVKCTPSSVGRWPTNIVFCQSDNGECPVMALDKQSGKLTSGRLDKAKTKVQNKIYGKRPKKMLGVYEADSGSASRFFKCFERD